MVSRTQKTKRRRYNRDRSLARERKRVANRKGTPVFPLHPEGYDPNAADAKHPNAADAKQPSSGGNGASAKDA